MPGGFFWKHGTEMDGGKPVLALDFDGVLHSYASGWQGACTVADEPVAGAQAFCERALEHFALLVFSSRCSMPGGAQAIMLWLTQHHFPAGMWVSIDGVKAPATVTLDDRAWRFDGEWPDVGELVAFKPWHIVQKRGLLKAREEADRG